MTPVTLEEMLEARDRRVERQRAFLAKYQVPLVYLTLNIPGPDKLPPNAQAAFSLACRQVESALGEKGWPILGSCQTISCPPTGRPSFSRPCRWMIF